MDQPLAQLGLAGLVITSLAVAVRYLYKEVARLQNVRVEDAKLREDRMSRTINKLTRTMELLNRKLDGQG